MKDLIRVHIQSKASLVILLIDDYTSKPVKKVSSLVSIKEVIQKPVKKNDACYVFTNIEAEICHLNIQSNLYFEENIIIDMKEIIALDPVVCIRLKPLPYYPFDSQDTLVRLQVKDARGQKVKGAKVNAIVQSPEGCKIKVIQEKIPKGNAILNFQSIAGTLAIGEVLYIEDKKKSEYCQIKKVIDYENRLFELIAPLTYEHERGTLFMPVVSTFTDSKGEAVIYFKYMLAKSVEIKLSVQYENEEKMQKISIEAGKTLNIESVHF